MVEYDVSANQTIYGYGYSDYQVIEHRHPTRYELDSVSTTNPILLVHYTGHIVVCNSLALGTVYNDNSSNPTGGSLDRYSNNNSLTGVAR
jgi:predicted amidohydrolase YtcJ